MKSEKGSLGFTLTKGRDHGCYIHDIVQDPAKSDGRLRPGDRMLKVYHQSSVNFASFYLFVYFFASCCEPNFDKEQSFFFLKKKRMIPILPSLNMPCVV